MKYLKGVQTIAKVFKVLTMVGMIFSFVGAGCCFLGGLTLIIWPALGETRIASAVISGVGGADLVGAGIYLLSETLICVAGAIVFVYANRYCKRELADGTPFTHHGAREIMALGIKTIVYPLAAVILASIICACFNAEGFGDVSFSNAAEVSGGILLMLLSVVFHYGAELEEKCKTDGGMHMQSDE